MERKTQGNALPQRSEELRGFAEALRKHPRRAEELTPFRAVKNRSPPSTSSHKWETYRRRRFGRFSRRRATSILRSVRTERATQKIGQSAIGPPGWLEKGLSASLLVRHVSQRIRSSLAPSIQTLLKPTACLPLMRRCTSLDAIRGTSLVDSETIVAGARQVISQLS